MCGIAGIFAYADAAPPVDETELIRVRDYMARRGPDGKGLWVSNDRRVGLAHRRLAIIDMSEGGAQPMATADGRLTISFNGEIYNYRELRYELEGEGYVFRTQSDTEVLLHLYADLGASMVHRLRGMFAFGIWDAREQMLFLARDPFGIKPLYYADDGRTVRFASQVKALLAGGNVNTAAEPAGSVGFLLWGCVPEPFTLYRGVSALPAGSTLIASRGAAPELTLYFSVCDELRSAQANAHSFQERDRVALSEMLRDSVRHHLVSDVPVGVFLSSGVDSTLITSLASEELGVSLRTLTLGFREYRGTIEDEVPLAESTAARLGTRHETREIGQADFESALEAIKVAMDQPTTDGVNMWLICREAARAGLKVALSGLGGDELFAGYPSFSEVPRLARWLGLAARVPLAGKITRAALAPILTQFTSPKYAGLLEYGGSYEGAYLLRRALFMPWELRHTLDPVAVHVGLERLRTLPVLADAVEGLREPRARITALETTWYMRNQLLRDADWAGMAHSVEVRVPLVDVALFRALAPWLVSARPPGKTDAAMAPQSPISRDILRRPKSGFSVPVRAWTSGGGTADKLALGRGLRNWAQHLLPLQPGQFRALVLLSDAFGGHGGIAKFNCDLLAAMSAMPECAEVVAVPRRASTPLEPVPPRVKFVAEVGTGKLHYLWAAAREAMSGPFDVVVAAHINLAAVGALFSCLKGARSAVVIHGIDAWQRHSDPLVRASLKTVDRIIGVSQVTLSRFSRWSRVDSKRLRLLPNCVDLARFTAEPKPTNLARQLGIENRTVIMTLGRLAAEERYKGFDEVIDALPRLARISPNICYLICGEGSDRDRLERKTRELGVADRVIFSGFVPESRKADYYHLADAYVMPSRGEGFGIVLLEAMACGIPVMGSRADGSREALLDGQLGILVNPDDDRAVAEGILRTIKQPRCVPEGLKHFSYENYVQRARNLLLDMVSASSPK